MTVHIDISNRQKMDYLVELLKSLDFVERVRVDEEDAPLSDRPSRRSAFVARHNGAIPHLDVKAFENHVAETRNEWEQLSNSY